MVDVRGKRVLVVGLAKSGRAAALCLSRKGAVVTVTDRKPPSAFEAILPELATQKVGLELGLQRPETFLRHDLIVISPGVPWDLPELRAARERGIPVFPEVEVGSWFLSGRLVGITGTNGKSTTTMLLGRMLEASGFPTFVGGNIGVPLISAVDQASPDSLLVTELSSYQLEAIHALRPHVAVLLNITSHHMDRHPSFENYVRAKAQIFRHQGAEDYAVLNADDPTVMGLAPEIPSRKILFSRRHNLPAGVLASNRQILYRVNHLERVLFETRDTPLRGDFNVENVMAAAATACALGADFEALRKTVREFKGLPHRLEFVREIRGVQFYDDSKATSVDAACKALGAFERDVHLILGGKDEGTSFAPLRPWLDRVRDVYLIGAAAEHLARELSGAAELIRAGDLETAMRKAFARALPSEVVLLAPACPSFDQFQDFEHRGQVFKEIAETLARETSEAGGLGSGFGSSPAPGPNSGLRVKAAGSPGPESLAPSRKSRVPISDSPLPNPESRTPNPELRDPAPERVYAYEVEAEQVAPLETDAPPESRVSQLSGKLRPSEGLQDEALPFEVRTSEAKSDTKAGGSHKGPTRQSRPRGS